jgi:hypothetical protein
MHSDMPSIILDVVSVIDAETSCAENSGEERQRFCFIVKETEKVRRILSSYFIHFYEL